MELSDCQRAVFNHYFAKLTKEARILTRWHQICRISSQNCLIINDRGVTPLDLGQQRPRLDEKAWS